ncbi:hypothetical protein WJX72_009667 [[Myrmecia] bisecta]|uniref:GYF domain-containing protein n=1 Tax=[Myrmecia] bisecta TaxID=41462 RepID=A0AAW1QG10_9CHLO
MRSARYFEKDRSSSQPRRGGEEPQREGRNQSRPEWFGHDNRAEQPVDTQQQMPKRKPVYQGGTVPAEGALRVEVDTEQGHRRIAVAPAQRTDAPRGWSYQDPEGTTHGPYSAAKILAWVEKGFLPPSLEVQQADSEAWVRLDQVLPQLLREARLAATLQEGVSSSPAREADQGASHAATHKQRGNGRSRVNVTNARRQDQESSRAAPLQSKKAQRQHPAEALMGDESRGRPLHAAEDASAGNRQRRAGGPAAPAAPRRQGGPTPQSRPAARAVPPAPQEVPLKLEARKLFTGEEQGSDEPLWRYRDPAGTIQGPFPAKAMIQWYNAGLLPATLPCCGTVRKVAPPDLPDHSLYQPLGQLLKRVQAGIKFEPLTVEEVSAANAEQRALHQKGSTSPDGLNEAPAGPPAMASSSEGARVGLSTGDGSDRVTVVIQALEGLSTN